MTRFERFLDELDQRWTKSLPDRVTFRVIGSTALFLQTAYERGTRDGDVLRLVQDGLDDATCTELERLAGADSKLFDQHRLFLDLVRPSLPFLPADPLWHAYPHEWSHFRVAVLDVTDVCVSKLKRWVGSDREDVSLMIRRGHVDHAQFVARFLAMVDHNAFDARAPEALPAMLARLHEVERDLFALPSTSAVALPRWIEEA